MIVANLATYPPRRSFLDVVLKSISPQVDRVNLVLNEYDEIPEEVRAFENVHPIIPAEDTKDTGKFLPDISDSTFVFFVDDDLFYPHDYVTRSLARMDALPFTSALCGYHCSVYRKPKLRLSPEGGKAWLRFHLKPNMLAAYRDLYGSGNPVKAPILVDQVATCAAVMRGKDVPPFDYMRTSQKFVDVRLAKWCFERGIPRVCIALDKDWLTNSDSLGHSFAETIVNDFTYKHHPHVADEIRSFAFRTPRVGQPA